MQFKLPYEVELAIDILQRNGFEAYLVGGAIRDFIMGLEPNDFDITTNATASEISNAFNDYNQFSNSGFEHATISIIINEKVIEITPFRGDEDTLISDLGKRDFTINALAFSKNRGLIGLKEGDNFVGVDDINYRVIRCVNSPVDRFNEDPLRILRAIRLAVTLDFNIESFTKMMIFQYKHLLKDVSIERIREEFNRIIVAPKAPEYLMEYRDVFAVFIPEIADMFDFDQKNKYHPNDLYTHTLNVLSLVKPDLTTKLAAFFHDIGKPQSVVFDRDLGDRYYHYYNHPVAGEKMTRVILKRLKMSNSMIDDVCKLVLYHDYNFSLSMRNTRRLLNKLYPNEDYLLPRLLDLKHADYVDHVNIEQFIIDLDKVYENYEQIKALRQAFTVKDLAVNGNVLAEYGFKGEAIGKKLNEILDLVIDGKIENTKEEIRKYLDNLDK